MKAISRSTPFWTRLGVAMCIVAAVGVPAMNAAASRGGIDWSDLAHGWLESAPAHVRQGNDLVKAQYLAGKVGGYLNDRGQMADYSVTTRLQVGTWTCENLADALEETLSVLISGTFRFMEGPMAYADYEIGPNRNHTALGIKLGRGGFFVIDLWMHAVERDGFLSGLQETSPWNGMPYGDWLKAMQDRGYDRVSIDDGATIRSIDAELIAAPTVIDFDDFGAQTFDENGRAAGPYLPDSYYEQKGVRFSAPHRLGTTSVVAGHRNYRSPPNGLSVGAPPWNVSPPGAPDTTEDSLEIEFAYGMCFASIVVIDNTLQGGETIEFLDRSGAAIMSAELRDGVHFALGTPEQRIDRVRITERGGDYDDVAYDDLTFTPCWSSGPGQ
jgi:hypothetical protein